MKIIIKEFTDFLQEHKIVSLAIAFSCNNLYHR